MVINFLLPKILFPTCLRKQNHGVGAKKKLESKYTKPTIIG